MRPTVILHIGTNKTGTTALQATFSRNRSALASRGVLYPVAGSRGGAHYALSDALGFLQGKTAPDPEALAAMKAALDKELAATGAHTVVFSSENFMLPKQVAPVKSFLEGYDVRVVVYLRRHDSWWESAWSQAVTMVANPAFKRGPEQYIAYFRAKQSTFGKHRWLVDRWAEVFGRENMVVRPYEKQQNKPDIVVDFLRHTGLDKRLDGLALHTERVNESVSPRAVQLMEYYQRADIAPEVRARLIAHARTIPGPKARTSLIPPGYRRRLVRENAEDYAYIARTYLGRENGKLFLTPLPGKDDEWTPPKEISPTFMIEQTVLALGGNKP